MKAAVKQGMPCVQVWNEEDAEEEVLAIVVRTGLHTSMGAMMRQIVYNSRPSMPRFIKVSSHACLPIALPPIAFALLRPCVMPALPWC